MFGWNDVQRTCVFALTVNFDWYCEVHKRNFTANEARSYEEIEVRIKEGQWMAYTNNGGICWVVSCAAFAADLLYNL